MICPSCAYECDPIEETCPNCGRCLSRAADRADDGAGECEVDSVSDHGDPFASPAVQALVRVAPTRVIQLAPGDRLVLGRTNDSPVADLCGSNISRHHAEIYVNQFGVFVQDSNSTNGTFVDGERLPPSSPHQIEATTEVRLGVGDDRDPPFRVTIEVNGKDGR